MVNVISAARDSCSIQVFEGLCNFGLLKCAMGGCVTSVVSCDGLGNVALSRDE